MVTNQGVSHVLGGGGLSSKKMTLTNLEPDVMQRAWVPHGAQDVGKLYFHQGGGAVVYSLQRAPPETSVRETALPFLRVKLAGTWGRRREPGGKLS